MKFLLNENVNKALALALRESGYKAEMVRDYLGQGLPDGAILEKAVQEGWIGLVETAPSRLANSSP